MPSIAYLKKRECSPSLHCPLATRRSPWRCSVACATSSLPNRARQPLHGFSSRCSHVDSCGHDGYSEWVRTTAKHERIDSEYSSRLLLAALLLIEVQHLLERRRRSHSTLQTDDMTLMSLTRVNSHDHPHMSSSTASWEHTKKVMSEHVLERFSVMLF